MASPTEPQVTAGGAPGARSFAWAPLVLFALVTVGVYAWAKSVNPDPTTSLFGQKGTDSYALKAWIATGVLALAGVQLLLALRLYGKIGGPPPATRTVGRTHRVIGTVAILATVPVAYHCLFAYGFETFSTRTVIHAVAGCFLYGAVAAKVLIVQSRRLPGWQLPVAGGLLLTLIVVLWFSSAFWYFNDYNAGASSSTSGAGYRAPAGTAGATGAIAMKNIQLSPAHATVKVGQTVTWTNDDAVDHNVTATSGANFHSKNFGQGGTFSFKPTKPGTIGYVCTIHPNMVGTLTVAR